MISRVVSKIQACSNFIDYAAFVHQGDAFMSPFVNGSRVNSRNWQRTHWTTVSNIGAQTVTDVSDVWVLTFPLGSAKFRRLFVYSRAYVVTSYKHQISEIIFLINIYEYRYL